jgi:hypothetical protein
MGKRLIALALTVIGTSLGVASVAQASITELVLETQDNPGIADDGWQSGSCLTESPADHCVADESARLFTQAGGHPPFTFTQEILKHPPVNEEGKTIPFETLKDIRVELPVGLTVNAESAERCPLSSFVTPVPTCLDAAKVGQEEVEVSLLPFGGVLLPPDPANGTLVPNYDLEPKFGEPALFGFVIGGASKVFLETDVAWESDYHESFTIRDIAKSDVTRTLLARLINNGRPGEDETGITNPTTCFSPDHYETVIGADSYEHEDPAAGDPKLPNSGRIAAAPLVSPTGCDLVPFDPTIDVDPGTATVDSPAPAVVTTELPYITGGDSISESHLRNATVVLPKGMGINAAGSDTLQACTDKQFHIGERVNQNECPSASVIGTAEIESPPFPPGSLKGKIYLGTQLSSDPASGEEFRILVEAESERYGLHVRLIGHVKADPKTGQLTTEFVDTPQAPFEAIRLRFDGAVSVLSSWPTCATAVTTSTMVPWSTPNSTKSPSDSSALSQAPGGAACPTSLAQRTFQPGYTTHDDSTKGGAFSPFRVHIGRQDGEQELKVVDATFPKGLTGKLAGIPYCPEQAIAAASGRTGKAELATPSCSSASQVGSVETTSGTGNHPLKLGGKVYLAGPYKTAPLSLVTVTPAVAGPFDLGTVVVRVALNVNPETAQINAVSDVIPDVFGGVKLDLRAIDFNLDRNQFMLNPTNCSAQATAGALRGGGADPTNPAAFSSFAFSDPFQATECDKLGFKPKLKVKLSGPTTRNKFPRLKATLTARNGDANIARTALTMPHTLFLEQGHIGTVCTRPQLASHTCPKASVYGTASAKSPLLDEKLKGNVFLVSSNHKLPDLLVDLRGQVEVYLRGVIGTKHGGLKTVFNNVPDVPVSKFVLNMKGGKKGLLVNSDNLCKKTQRAVMKMLGQNGKKVANNRFELNVASCGKSHHKHKKHKGHHHRRHHK